MKLDFMKLFIFLCLSTALFACNHVEKDTTLMGQDLSGTWVHTRYDIIYDRATGAYLRTSMIEERIVIKDDPVLGILAYDCWDVAGSGDSAYKTNTHLYLNSNTDAFKSIGTDVLETDLETDIIYGPSTPIIMDRYKRLEKLSDGIDVDRGMLVLNGPITLSETNTVCVLDQYSDINTDHIYDLLIPYDNALLYMRMEIFNGLTSGTHNYIQFTPTAEIFNFQFISTSANFWSIVGSNLIAPTTATINITESTNNNIAGTFTFVGPPGASNYTGEFSMETTP